MAAAQARWLPPKVVPEQSGARLEVGRDQPRRRSGSRCHALGHGDQVGTDAAHWWAKKRPCGRSRLDFVQHELGARFGSGCAQAAQEFVRGAVDARNALNALDDDGGEFAQSRAWRGAASRSFSGVNSTLGVPLNGERMEGLSVAATAPDVRPWKALEKASTLARPSGTTPA